MRNRIVFCFAVMVACGSLTSVAADDKKMTAQQLDNRFFRSWLVIKSIDEGEVTVDPDRLGGVHYSKKDGESWGWGRSGEFSVVPINSKKIDGSTSPMRVDVLVIKTVGIGLNPKKERWIIPGIFKFENQNLIIATGWLERERQLKPGEDYKTRPTEFRSTKENGVNIVIMKPCADWARD